MANKFSGIKVQSEWTMGSEHAPVICSFTLNKTIIQHNEDKILRFNLSQANWVRFGVELDKSIGRFEPENLVEASLANETFVRGVTQAAEASIPKFALKSNKSFPHTL